jgi:uncharacterized protein (DUF305 family)
VSVVEEPAPAPSGSDLLPQEQVERRGGLSGVQIVVLVAAVAFLVGAIAYVVGDRSGSADPLNDVDVGFMQDMSYHHDQAVQMALMLQGKEDIDPNMRSFAQEVVIGQRYEQGVFSATLDRYGHSSDPGESVMGWMGEPQPASSMPGLATEEQLQALQDAEGEDAEALWIALMSEHHLAGLHMADYAARHGEDETTVNLANAIVKNQRSEILDYARFRRDHDLPIPKGFSDPTKDQRLDPLSFREHHD